MRINSILQVVVLIAILSACKGDRYAGSPEGMLLREVDVPQSVEVTLLGAFKCERCDSNSSMIIEVFGKKDCTEDEKEKPCTEEDLARQIYNNLGSFALDLTATEGQTIRILGWGSVGGAVVSSESVELVVPAGKEHAILEVSLTL